MNVVVIQFDMVWENKTANFDRVHHWLAAAAPEKDSLVLLPEMFATGFSMNAEVMAESPGGKTEQFLSATAKEFGICLAGGAAIRGRDGRIRNKLLVFSPAGELLAFYAKQKLFSPGGEQNHYAAGEKNTVFHWGGGVISPFICYDLRFPEIFRKVVQAHRPEIFLLAASWPQKRLRHWTLLLQARAIENQAYIVAANRVGNDPYYAYGGGSIIVDPQGEILADAGPNEGFAQARLDLGTLQKYRAGLPFLHDL